MANRVVRINIPKIRELAKEKNMNMKQLELKAGIANGAIGKWVEGDARVDKAYRVAAALDTTIDNILEKA